MLMTRLKAPQALEALTAGKVFLLICHGCKEIGFPEAEAEQLRRKLREEDRLTGELVTDYLCDPDRLGLRLRARMEQLLSADTVLVLSCGVGVQTVSELLEDAVVAAGCDTVALPGFQGLTPTEYDCARCGQCFLNLTGGICPITACSKSLVNGPCGGAKNGKCEVSDQMDCGWERILRKLREQDRLDVLRQNVQLRNFGIAAGTDGK